MCHKPDWNTNCIIYGGHIADIPSPHVLFFPHPCGVKRRVTINVSTYSGFPHLWVSLKEEPNLIWDARERCWRKALDDGENRGRHFEKQCMLTTEAHDFIVATVKNHFPKQTHKVEGESRWLNPKIVHIYKREGD